MRLIRISLLEGKPLGILEGFEHAFAPQSSDTVEPLCFVGANGTGKSRLLQSIAEIFFWLDSRTRLFRPEPQAPLGFRFELEYEVNVENISRHILVRHVDDKNSAGFFEIDKAGDEQPVTSEKDIRALLPKFVVGYTSGENETLSVPFLDVRQEYAREVGMRAIRVGQKDTEVPDLRLVMMDYHANFAIIAANFLLQPAERLAFFKKYIRMSDIDSFRIVIQLHHQRPKSIKLTKQLRENIEQLRSCATSHQYHPREQRWTLDFVINEATRKAFAHFFKNSYELYMVFQRLSMLNDLIIPKKHLDRINRIRREQKIVVKPPMPAEEDKVFRFETVKLRLQETEVILDYISLSDGEHQFLHIFGTLLIFDQPNIVFLLDEPESHFNPQWRIEFVELLNQIAIGKHQCFLLTSHAPFVISDCKAQNVQVFRRVQPNKVEVSPPKNETYGASFDGLLQDVFDIKPPPVARKSLKELRELETEGTIEEIEERLDEFGDSPEKFFLFQRIEKLKTE